MRHTALIIFTLNFISVIAFSKVNIHSLDNYSDKDGCIPLSEFAEEPTKPKSCPNTFSPAIRPKTTGTLNPRKTDAKKKLGFNICCYDWETFGNR